MLNTIAHPDDSIPLLISDLDGTLTNFRHRLHYLKSGTKPDWLAFNSSACADPPVAASINLLRMAFVSNWQIAIVTGRSDKQRPQSQNWLARHKVPYHLLYMRTDGDNRSDVDVKLEIYLERLKHKNIQFVLEDRDKLVEMWRGLGLTCFQVQKGAY